MSEKNRRYNKYHIKNKKALISLISVILIAATTIVFVLAYKTDKTVEVINEFETPEIETPIEEEFDGKYKEDVTATNSADSDVDVYVRLKFVVNTMDDSTGEIVATPSSYDEYGYLANHATTIVNVFDVAGLNTLDWMLDPIGDGVYYYKYSLAPGESAYDLVSSIYQTVYYDGVKVTLTILVDSVQVDSVQDVWTDVIQSDYVDVNGNKILYLADDETTEPSEDYTDYTSRYAEIYDEDKDEYVTGNYDTTSGKDSSSNNLG